MAAATAVATRMIRMGASGAVDLGHRAPTVLLREFIAWRQRAAMGISGDSTGYGSPDRGPCSVAKAPQRGAFGIEIRVPIGGHCPSRKEPEPWRARLRGLANARSAMAANASRGHGCGLSGRID